jgi:hypothetical protein
LVRIGTDEATSSYLDFEIIADYLAHCSGLNTQISSSISRQTRAAEGSTWMVRAADASLPSDLENLENIDAAPS